MVGELRKEESFFESTVPSADNRDVVRTFIEGAITGRTKVNARPNEIGLAIGVGASIGRTCRHENRIAPAPMRPSTARHE